MVPNGRDTSFGERDELKPFWKAYVIEIAIIEVVLIEAGRLGG